MTDVGAATDSEGARDSSGSCQRGLEPDAQIVGHLRAIDLVQQLVPRARIDAQVDPLEACGTQFSSEPRHPGLPRDGVQLARDQVERQSRWNPGKPIAAV